MIFLYSVIVVHYIDLILKFIYLFIFKREDEKEKKRRETSMCERKTYQLPLAPAQLGGPGPHHRHVS